MIQSPGEEDRFSKEVKSSGVNHGRKDRTLDKRKRKLS